MVKKVCEYCKEKILYNDKYILLATISPKLRQESYFHFYCFKKNHDEKVQAKAKAIIQNVQSKAIGTFNGIKGLLGNFKGLEQIGSMLKLNLNEEIPTFDGEEYNFEDNSNKKSVVSGENPKIIENNDTSDTFKNNKNNKNGKPKRKPKRSTRKNK